jgi:DMSO/TMAO reductase YedYZ molybdopterin-dependent catalytic subunit
MFYQLKIQFVKNLHSDFMVEIHPILGNDRHDNCVNNRGGKMKKNILFLSIFFLVFNSYCKEGVNKTTGFPPFITPNKDYYITRINGIPKINGDTYTLEVKGLVENPGKFRLDDLYSQPMKELPLTVECIGNSPNGPLLSTAVWKGFLLYDFLEALGLDERAVSVRYEGADGYFASHTLDQIKTNGVMVALYMNGVPIPPLHGYPVRILNPGYHGVKQPAWIVSIEVLDKVIKDYWEVRGWDCSPPMAVDSTIFFPKKKTSIKVNQPLRIGGAAFGGTRISKVEVTTDRGQTWKETSVVKRMDVDNIWVFWEIELIFPESGNFLVNVRATDIHGNTQQESDPDRYDGSNDWPVLKVKVKK